MEEKSEKKSLGIKILPPPPGKIVISNQKLGQKMQREVSVTLLPVAAHHFVVFSANVFRQIEKTSEIN